MTQRSKKNENRRRRSANAIAVAHSKRGAAGAGAHPAKNRYNRRPKHKRSWDDQDLEDENDYEE